MKRISLLNEENESQLAVESAKFHRWFVFRVCFLLYDDDEGGKQMDQKKIGNFISTCRKEMELTQVQLAEKLNITNRAVSKWETGKSIPDASIMLDLCQILGITVNELLSGERITTMENYQNKAEENLVEMQEKKAKADRDLKIGIKVGLVTTLVLFIINMFMNYFVPDHNVMALGYCNLLIIGSLFLTWFFNHYEFKLK